MPEQAAVAMTTLLRLVIDAANVPMPEGCTDWGMRTVHADFSSSRGYKWPYPGNWAYANGPFVPNNNSACPAAVGDGICLANTASGIDSGGIKSDLLLLCAYSKEDLLSTYSVSKVRVKKAYVAAALDASALFRRERVLIDEPTLTFLSGAVLHDARLDGSILSDAEFARCNLNRASFRDANLHGVYFIGANLCSSNFIRALLKDCIFKGADISYSRFDEARADYARFSRVNAYNVSFKRIVARNADFSTARLTGCDFTGADLSGANFSGAWLEDANFAGATLTWAMFHGAGKVPKVLKKHIKKGIYRSDQPVESHLVNQQYNASFAV